MDKEHKENLKKQLFDFLKTQYGGLKPEEICNEMGIVNTDDISLIQELLEEGVKEYTLYFTNKKKYILIERCPNFIVGTVQIKKKGFGFVVPDKKEDGTKEEDVFIKEEDLNKALNGDYVLVEITKEAVKGDNPEGKILRILKRDKNNIIGEVKIKDGQLYFEPVDKKVGFIHVPQDELDKCVAGEIICVKLATDFKKLVASEIVHLGHKDDARIDVLEECAKYDIFDQFPEDCIQQVEALPTKVRPEDLEGRVDLRDKMIFTIDGADTKDIDDAISLEIKDGYYYLGVHIADVTYYVPEGSPLDREAYRRGTSTYPASYVIPMYPHTLSSGICSLWDNQDRLAVTCMMKINSKGKVVDYEAYNSVIRSRKKMTYDAVNQIIEDDVTPEGYEEFAETLKNMQTLAHIIRNERTLRGASDFEVDELKVVCDDEGKPEKIAKRTRGEGEKLIEDFMVVANETVCYMIAVLQLVCIFRIHDKPQEDKLSEFIHFCELNGIHLKMPKEMTAREFQKMLNEIPNDDPQFAQILRSKLIRTMSKAIYSPDNIGHFGLASENYAHFTSPIRRYPDDILHRLVKDFIIDHKLDKKTIEFYENHMDEWCRHCSDREQASDKAEREVDKMKMAEYMENYLAENPVAEFQVMVTDVRENGMYCAIDNGIEGFIPIATLKGDRFEYDETMMCLIGNSTKKTYSIGDRLFVRCTRASKEDKQIDFELVKDLKLEEEQQEKDNAKKLTLNNGRG